jgi:hypothetical protein
MATLNKPIIEATCIVKWWGPWGRLVRLGLACLSGERQVGEYTKINNTTKFVNKRQF